jgi:hypothetical protein
MVQCIRRKIKKPGHARLLEFPHAYAELVLEALSR